MLQVLCALRFYATGAFQRVIGSTMNVGAMSVWRSVHSVSAILAVNSNRDISFPRNHGAVISTREGFYNLAGFPKVLGAIDGSLVPIIAPSENEPVYVSRKGYHAINGTRHHECRTPIYKRCCSLAWEYA